MENNRDSALQIAHDIVRAEQLLNRLVDKLLGKLGVTRAQVDNNKKKNGYKK